MSEWRERYDETPALANALEWLESYYHYVVLGILATIMVWLRTRNWGRFLVDGEVLFNGNDAWYHYRQIVYTVDHWPQTLPYEVYTNFPQGTAPGQFGTFYDQIIATLALIVGLGNPSDQLVAMVALFAPALFAVALLVPTYLLGKRLGGRAGGVAAGVVVAFATGSVLTRSMAGSVDHQIAEPVFQALGILGIAIALSVARREKPIFEQLLERDLEALRPTIAWSTLAGVAVATYLWVWPFGVLLIGILGIFFLIQLSAEFVRGESPDHTAMVGALSMSVTGVLLLAMVQFTSFSPSDFTLLQPVMAFGLAAWCLGMAWFARKWEASDRPAWAFPLSVVAILLALVLVVRVVTPSIYNLFANNLIRILGLGFGVSQQALSVGEISPLGSPGRLYLWFKFALFAAIASTLWIGGRVLIGQRVRAESLLVVVWAIIVTMATFTQARFSYYMAVPVAVLTGYLIGELVDRFSLTLDTDFTESFKIVAVATIAILLVLPMILFTPAPAAVGDPVFISDQNSPGQDIQGWTQSLEWFQQNTPAEGQFGDGSTTMEYDGTYPITSNYDYPDGAFGVMSWWDYGHWITVQSQTIPVANPFQQHATEAANFLLAPNETQAGSVLDDVSEDDAQTRFVAVDWKMVNTYTTPILQSQQTRINGKFFAPTRFYDVSNVNRSDYWERLYFEQSTNQGASLFSMNYRKQPYYESMVTRLYRFHGSAVEPNPIVIDWEVRQSQVAGQGLRMTWSGSPGQAVRVFDNMSAAREFVRNDTTSQIGGFAGNPSERVPALEHYRYVGSSTMDAASRSRGYQLSKWLTDTGLGINRSAAGPLVQDTSSTWTKLFERVPGATIEGTGPANTNVTAYVEMQNEITDETFTYQQRVRTDSQGEFTMTLPYSTTGYDEWGPSEGRTNVSVRATGPYQFVTTTSEGGNMTGWNATAQVSEGAVIGESEEPVTVELSEMQAPSPEGATATDGGNGSGPTDSTGSGTDSPGNDTTGQIAPIAGVRP